MIRYVGEEMIHFRVRNLYRGQTVFLLGGSPTLMKQNYKRLETPGIISIGINNTPTVVHTTMAMFGDAPECYDQRLLHDPTILKFARFGAQNFKLKDGSDWKSMPNMVFFQHVPLQRWDDIPRPAEPDDNVECVHSHINTYEMVLSTLITMGFARIVLVGCSFDSGYSYGASLTSDQAERNKRLYGQQVVTTKKLKQTFMMRGVTLVDASLDSKLGDTYDVVSLDDEIDRALGMLPPVSKPSELKYCTDLGTKKFGSASAFGSGQRLHIVFSMGVYDEASPSILSQMRLQQLLFAFLSVAKTTANAEVHFFHTGVKSNYLAAAAKILSTGDNLVFDSVDISPKTVESRLKGAKMNGIGTHSMLRLLLPDLLPKARECLWLDCDVIVFDDLYKLFSEARDAVRGTSFKFAMAWPLKREDHHSNAGVMYMDLDGMRKTPGFVDRLLALCANATHDLGNGVRLNMVDEDAINAVGSAYLDYRWDICLHEYEMHDPLPDDRGIVHFTGWQKYMWRPLAETEEYSFLKEYAYELNKLLPDLPEDYRALGSADISRLRKITHVAGRPEPQMLGYRPETYPANPSEVHIAYAVSDAGYARTSLPASIASYADGCSLPLVVHVASLDDPKGYGFLDDLLQGLSVEHRVDFDVRQVPDGIREAMDLCGDTLPDAGWRNHLASAVLHDVFDDVDACVKVDADTICVSDVAVLYSYAMRCGVGRDLHFMGLRSRYRENFACEYILGVSPMWFKGLRESGFDDYFRKKLLYGSRLLVDEIMTGAYVSGIISGAGYPPHWQLLQSTRQKFRDEYATEFHIHAGFYGCKFRPDGYIPLAHVTDYRKHAGIYHFSGVKPWYDHPDGLADCDRDLWMKYDRMASAYMGVSK